MVFDYQDELESKPWGKRKRVVPLQTWSGKVVHDRPRHKFSEKDVARIMKTLEPPDLTNASSWMNSVLNLLRWATIMLMNRILFFLDATVVDYLYEFAIDLLDKMFQVNAEDQLTRSKALHVMAHMAARADISYKLEGK